MRLGDGFASNFPVHHIDSTDQRRLFSTGFAQAVICQEFDVAVGHIGQGLGSDQVFAFYVRF